ncbi:MAG: restriction endonuclease [Nanoarchaeota archaeon]|nr:restriction endonuclease [Nanoarchaeota archaeon]MCG2719012.1 restriction endonuclease [Nanoarchaeota archaeon]
MEDAVVAAASSMYVIKASGEKQKFNRKKLIQTILNAGASDKLLNKTLRKVKKESYKGIKTGEILRIILASLKEEPGVAQRYNIKRAIMMLGPTGFPFEKFVARVLEEYGYKTRVGVVVKGKCVAQEVDVEARKGKKKYMIECKYHNSPGKKSDLKVAMYTYARFLDVKHKKYNQPWLVTNTKCTNEAEKYAGCSGLKIISWRYPKNKGLEQLLIEKGLYPITTLSSINFKTKQKLVNANIMLLKDLFRHRIPWLRIKTKLPKKVIERLKKEAIEIMEPQTKK